MASYSQTRKEGFFGWRVVGAAFVLGFFGWGVAFYGPPVFLSVLHETRGWPIPLISSAVTAHFLIGAIVGGNLPRLHGRFGASVVTKTGALCMATGLFGWASAMVPWHLFVAAVFSGVGWGTMSAAALNAFVSPWFVRARPTALGMAYNGGSVGGIVFSPLWVAAIALLGFPITALAVGAVMAVTIWVLTDLVLSRTPASMGLRPDGDVSDVPVASFPQSSSHPLPGSLLWRDRQFLTLAAGMALGLFAQIGLIAHLYSLLVPALGRQEAGLAMGSITAMAIAGRMILGRVMKPGTDRRLAACCGYAAQLAGSIVFFCAAGRNVPLLLLGIALFGVGFGNATSLPPLIAQVEFDRRDVPRAVALIVAIAQGSFAFAPAVFSLIRDITPASDSIAPGASPLLFATAASIQGLAILAFLAGRGR